MSTPEVERLAARQTEQVGPPEPSPQRLDQQRAREAPIDVVVARLEAVARLPYGPGFVRDLLEAAARHASDRSLRTDAIGALWQSLTFTPNRGAHQHG